MTMVYQPVPSGDTLGDAFARELALLFGPAYQPADGTLIAEDLRTTGDSLADVYTTMKGALDEIFPDTAVQMLPEWEERLGVPTNPNATTAFRQSVVTAKRRAGGGNSALRVLTAVQAVAPDATVVPNTVGGCRAFPRNVFQWVVTVKPAEWGDPPTLARLQDIVRQMKPVHTRCAIATRVGFYCDDPNSLTDRDVLRV